jgi:hypothetical protein
MNSIERLINMGRFRIFKNENVIIDEIKELNSEVKNNVKIQTKASDIRYTFTQYTDKDPNHERKHF